MNETQDRFLNLMQTVLDEIKISKNDYRTHLLNTCLSHLTEANNDYLDVIHYNSDKNWWQVNKEKPLRKQWRASF